MEKYVKMASIVIVLFLVMLFSSCASEINKNQSKGLSIGTTQGKQKNSSSKSGERKEALIVGVSDYAGEDADLNGIEQDVQKMKKLFQNWGFTVKILYDKESLQVVNYLSQYGNKLNKKDYFAFYYSGHGSYVDDKNNDELDKQDETLVLSDGKENTHLIDDVLYAKFNAIKAKKMIFFDSCHSGTVFRKINKTTQSKTLSPEQVKKTFSKGLSFQAKGDNIDKNSDFIVFSSSRDNEESLATTTGSLFTNSIYEIFQDQNSENKSFAQVNQILTSKILNYANASGDKAHHPSISFSKLYSNSNTVNDFLQKKSVVSNTIVSSPVLKKESLQQTLENLLNSKKLQSMSLSYDKDSYRDGESIEFILDTKGSRGYLTIFYVDTNDVTLLYPNPFIQTRKIEGKYNFPKDLSNGKFELEAYKSCQNCQEEKTVIYTLLSAQPILDASAIQRKGVLKSFGKNSHEAKIMTRAVRVKATSSHNSFKAQFGKYELIVR